jgi:hypothetical protein
LCGVDLAAWRGVRAPSAFHFSAHTMDGRSLAVTSGAQGKVCVTLTHGRDTYTRVAIDDGVAKGKLVVHVYDLGERGFRLAGLTRPE